MSPIAEQGTTPRRWRSAWIAALILMVLVIGWLSADVVRPLVEWRDPVTGASPSPDSHAPLPFEATKPSLRSTGPDDAAVAEGQTPLRSTATPSDTAAVDAEWARIPRDHYPFPDRVRCLGVAQRTANQLFRNHRLNPRDTYIPPDLRRVLSDHVRDAAPAVLALYRTAVDARNREWDELIAKGTLHPLQLTSDPRLRTKAERSLEAAAAHGRNVTFHDPSFFDDTKGVLWIRQVEGNHYGLRLADLGAALDAYATGWRASEEYAMQVLTWFHLAGCLTDAELAAESKPCLTGTAAPR